MVLGELKRNLLSLDALSLPEIDTLFTLVSGGEF
jgi:hypothetical protein